MQTYTDRHHGKRRPALPCQEILEFPGSVNGPWSRYISVDISLREMNHHAEHEGRSVDISLREMKSDAQRQPRPDLRPLSSDACGIGTVRYPRLVPKDEACARELAKRTLTNLYNTRPTWLHLAHCKLDAAVSTAYNWPSDLPDDEILSRLLALNLDRASREK